MNDLGYVPTDTLHIPIGFLTDLSETTDAEDVYATFARWVKVITRTDRAIVALADDISTDFHVLAVEGDVVNGTGKTIPIDGSLIGRVYLSRRSEVCEDLSQVNGAAEARLAEAGFVSCIAVPIAIGDRCWGSLALSFRDHRAATLENLLIVETMARCLASYVLLHEQVQALSRMALTDPLTKAFNRRYFQQSATESWELWSRGGQPFALIMFDLDHFKKINDMFGHDFGDQVLSQIAASVRGVTRASDRLVRMGGEEFCLILPGADGRAAMASAERLRGAIEASSFNHNGDSVRITASFGVASTEERYETLRSMTIAADIALYKAKDVGRNCVMVADEPRSKRAPSPRI